MNVQKIGFCVIKNGVKPLAPKVEAIKVIYDPTKV